MTPSGIQSFRFGGQSDDSEERIPIVLV
jgi:hypothetical protein